MIFTTLSPWINFLKHLPLQFLGSGHTSEKLLDRHPERHR